MLAASDPTKSPRAPLRVLILGGYGTFGARLARILADEPRLAVIVAGRSREKAEWLCASLPRAAAMLFPAAIDRDGDLAEPFAMLRPDVVVDASGPFQVYGADPYRVVREAMAQGAHYLDLADGAAFVMGVGALDAEARERGVFALAGASTAPALTVAVVRKLTEEFAHVEEIVAGIAPSPQLALGASVVRATASCGGKPVGVRRDGRTVTAFGLLDSRRVTIGAPGAVPLRPVRFSLLDVPDLSILPALWPEARNVWFGVGSRPEVVHRLLNCAAWLVRVGVLKSLLPLSPLMRLATRLVRWGENRSGMFVRVAGWDGDGLPHERSWHVTAHGEVGPDIPTLAAVAIVRRLLDGSPPPPGARPAIDDVSLNDYEPQFATRAIVTGVRDETAAADPELPLFRRLLGPAWDRLPAPVRALHDLPRGARAAAEGRAMIERGRGWLARRIADAFDFPPAGEDILVRVDFSAERGREIWRRTFGGVQFKSVLSFGRGSADALLTERFGPFALDMALVVGEDASWPEDHSFAGAAGGGFDRGGGAQGRDGARLRYIVRGWRVFGAPLPGALAPRGETSEHAAGGLFNFDVEIRLPLVGLIVAYRGWLAPAGVAVKTTVEPNPRSAVNPGATTP
jgi:hypothetical protein